MSDLDRRLDELAEQLIKLERSVEHTQLTQSITRLKDRIAELEAAAPSPGLSPTWKAALAGLLALMAPASTAIYGLMAERRQLLATEHEIVTSHLSDVLKGDASSPYDLTHLRHLRFLRRLAPENGQAGPDDLKALLGIWAEQEFQQKLTQIEKISAELAKDINERRVYIQWLEVELQLDRGWYEQERARWFAEDRQPDPKRTRVIRQRFQLRQAQIDDERKQLEKQERNWELLVAARGKRESPDPGSIEDEPTAPTEYLRRRCEAEPSDQAAITRSERLSACTLKAKLHYAHALEVGVDHPDYDRDIRLTNDLFEAACGESWAEGCDRLAQSYRLGHIQDQARQRKLEPPHREALKLLREGYRLGYAESYNGLGWHYLEGEGVEADPDRARELFDASCKLRSLNGCDSLGTWYHRQHKLEPRQAPDPDAPSDLELATRWYDTACRAGEIRGCVNLINLDFELDPSDFGTPKPTSEVASESVAETPLPPPPPADPPHAAPRPE